MSNKYYLIAAILGIAITTATVSTMVSAHSRGFNSDTHEAAQTALENNDYDAWLEAVGDSRHAEFVTEENFTKFGEAHQLRADGNIEGAKAIFDELDINARRWGHMKNYKFDSVQHTAMRDAVENNDYEAWLAAAGDDNRMTDTITADNFDQLVSAHELKEDGDFAGAREIMEELGMGQKIHRQGHRMHAK